MPVIELITVIRAPVERCFDLARSIDLHRLSTEGTEEGAIAGITSGLIGEGEQVTRRARHFGITQTLTSRITQFKYPRYFRDEMVEGPFRRIEHDHLFEAAGDQTIMRDRFEFESPGWIFGVAFNRIILEKYLRGMLQRRNRIIKEVAESKRWRSILNI